MNQYAKLTIAQLKDELAKLGIDYQNGLLKQQYINLLADAVQSQPQTTKQTKVSKIDTKPDSLASNRRKTATHIPIKPPPKPILSDNDGSNDDDNSNTWESDNHIKEQVVNQMMRDSQKKSRLSMPVSRQIPSAPPRRATISGFDRNLQEEEEETDSDDNIFQKNAQKRRSITPTQPTLINPRINPTSRFISQPKLIRASFGAPNFQKSKNDQDNDNNHINDNVDDDASSSDSGFSIHISDSSIPNEFQKRRQSKEFQEAMRQEREKKHQYINKTDPKPRLGRSHVPKEPNAQAEMSRKDRFNAMVLEPTPNKRTNSRTRHISGKKSQNDDDSDDLDDNNSELTLSGKKRGNYSDEDAPNAGLDTSFLSFMQSKDQLNKGPINPYDRGTFVYDDNHSSEDELVKKYLSRDAQKRKSLGNDKNDEKSGKNDVEMVFGKPISLSNHKIGSNIDTKRTGGLNVDFSDTSDDYNGVYNISKKTSNFDPNNTQTNNQTNNQTTKNPDYSLKRRPTLSNTNEELAKYARLHRGAPGSATILSNSRDDGDRTSGSKKRPNEPTPVLIKIDLKNQDKIEKPQQSNNDSSWSFLGKIKNAVLTPFGIPFGVVQNDPKPQSPSNNQDDDFFSDDQSFKPVSVPNIKNTDPQPLLNTNYRPIRKNINNDEQQVPTFPRQEPSNKGDRLSYDSTNQPYPGAVSRFSLGSLASNEAVQNDSKSKGHNKNVNGNYFKNGKTTDSEDLFAYFNSSAAKIDPNIAPKIDERKAREYTQKGQQTEADNNSDHKSDFPDTNEVISDDYASYLSNWQNRNEGKVGIDRKSGQNDKVGKCTQYITQIKQSTSNSALQLKNRVDAFTTWSYGLFTDLCGKCGGGENGTDFSTLQHNTRFGLCLILFGIVITLFTAMDPFNLLNAFSNNDIITPPSVLYAPLPNPDGIIFCNNRYIPPSLHSDLVVDIVRSYTPQSSHSDLFSQHFFHNIDIVEPKQNEQIHIRNETPKVSFMEDFYTYLNTEIVKNNPKITDISPPQCNTECPQLGLCYRGRLYCSEPFESSLRQNKSTVFRPSFYQRLTDAIFPTSSSSQNTSLLPNSTPHSKTTILSHPYCSDTSLINSFNEHINSIAGYFDCFSLSSNISNFLLSCLDWFETLASAKFFSKDLICSIACRLSPSSQQCTHPEMFQYYDVQTVPCPGVISNLFARSVDLVNKAFRFVIVKPILYVLRTVVKILFLTIQKDQIVQIDNIFKPMTLLDYRDVESIELIRRVMVTFKLPMDFAFNIIHYYSQLTSPNGFNLNDIAYNRLLTDVQMSQFVKVQNMNINGSNQSHIIINEMELPPLDTLFINSGYSGIESVPMATTINTIQKAFFNFFNQDDVQTLKNSKFPSLFPSLISSLTTNSPLVTTQPDTQYDSSQENVLAFDQYHIALKSYPQLSQFHSIRPHFPLSCQVHNFIFHPIMIVLIIGLIFFGQKWYAKYCQGFYHAQFNKNKLFLIESIKDLLISTLVSAQINHNQIPPNLGSKIINLPHNHPSKHPLNPQSSQNVSVDAKIQNQIFHESLLPVEMFEYQFNHKANQLLLGDVELYDSNGVVSTQMISELEQNHTLFWLTLRHNPHYLSGVYTTASIANPITHPIHNNRRTINTGSFIGTNSSFKNQGKNSAQNQHNPLENYAINSFFDESYDIAFYSTLFQIDCPLFSTILPEDAYEENSIQFSPTQRLLATIPYSIRYYLFHYFLNLIWTFFSKMLFLPHQSLLKKYIPLYCGLPDSPSHPIDLHNHPNPSNEGESGSVGVDQPLQQQQQQQQQQHHIGETLWDSVFLAIEGDERIGSYYRGDGHERCWYWVGDVPQYYYTIGMDHNLAESDQNDQNNNPNPQNPQNTQPVQNHPSNTQNLAQRGTNGVHPSRLYPTVPQNPFADNTKVSNDNNQTNRPLQFGNQRPKGGSLLRPPLSRPEQSQNAASKIQTRPNNVNTQTQTDSFPIPTNSLRNTRPTQPVNDGANRAQDEFITNRRNSRTRAPARNDDSEVTSTSTQAQPKQTLSNVPRPSIYGFGSSGRGLLRPVTNNNGAGGQQSHPQPSQQQRQQQQQQHSQGFSSTFAPLMASAPDFSDLPTESAEAVVNQAPARVSRRPDNAGWDSISRY